jgi:hypothetical protein
MIIRGRESGRGRDWRRAVPSHLREPQFWSSKREQVAALDVQAI